jgi:hypothetical protein
MQVTAVEEVFEYPGPNLSRSDDLTVVSERRDA